MGKKHREVLHNLTYKLSLRLVQAGVVDDVDS